ncbi:hypothetical protein FQR65_LT16232 [Abscondita terminalis]|nr:hypothetical protein FQR65_LT16232 [Abscondita terminalis]
MQRHLRIDAFRRYSNQVSMPACNFSPKEYEGPTPESLSKIRKNRLNPALATYYSKPLVLHQGHKQWLFDVDGRRYLDMFGGICTVSVGHCHPKITEAVTKQISTLGHVSNVYVHAKIHEYAEKLTDKLPGDLKVVYFVNSGSEANDLAILLARLYTGNFEIISLRNGYHGMTCQVMSLTANSAYRYPVPQASGFSYAMNPDVYRGLWGGGACRDGPVQTKRECSCERGQCSAGRNYLEQLEEVYRYNIPKGKAAAFFAESIQGVGGTVQYPKNYLKGAYDMIKNNNGLFVADEMHGIVPDIVTMAKGIGNGFPLAAVVTTPTIAAALTKAQHFNTFGGNPVSSAVGIAVLDILEEEKLQENAKLVGTRLLLELEKLRDRVPVIGDVRGKGLMIGVEMVSGNGSTEPLDSGLMMNFWDRLRELGVIIGRAVLRKRVAYQTSYVRYQDDAVFTVNVIKKALEDIF